MPLVLEDGSIVANANAYADIAILDAYLATRAHTTDAFFNLEVATKEARLIEATRLCDSLLSWAGEPVDPDHSVRWPRLYVALPDGRVLSSSVIPQALQYGICEQAMALDAGDRFAADAEGRVSSLTMGRTSVSYAQGFARPLIVPAAMAFFRDLLRPGRAVRVG